MLAQGRSLPLPRGRLYPPTTSAPDPGAGQTRRPRAFPSLLPPFVLRLAPTHLGWDTRRQFTRRSRDPPGVETPTVGAPGRGLLRVDELLPVKLRMGSLQQPFQPGTMLRFGSLEFMSLDGSYDMILLPPPRDSDNGGRQPRPPAAESTTSSPRGGRATSGSVPSPSPPTEEEAGQPWPSRRRHLVDCRASRRRRRPSGGHVGR